MWLQDVVDEDRQGLVLPAIGSGEASVVIPVSTTASALTTTGGKASGGLRVLGSAEATLAVVPASSGGERGWAVVTLGPPAAELRPLKGVWDHTRGLCDLACDGADVLFWVADPDGAAGRNLARHLALGLASDSIGGAGGILDRTLDYMKTRMQFGRLIGSFQALKHRVADHSIDIALNGHAVRQGVDSAAAKEIDADLWVAGAKAVASRTFRSVAAGCIQLHGGVGHTWEFDCHIYMKRARLNEALGAGDAAALELVAEAFNQAALAGRAIGEIPL